MSTKKTIVWHRLIDGNPPKSGRYIVGHRTCQT